MRAAVFLGALALVLGTGATAAPLPPILTVTTTLPFTVRGLHFRPNERVAVSVLHGRSSIHPVRASATGRFVTRFTGLRVGSCGLYLVRAVGSNGSRAAWLRPMRFACGAQPGPAL